MRGAWVLAIGLAVAGPGTAAETTQQFDLVCTKTVSGSGVRETNTRHYRIDLAAKRGCLDECQVAFSIEEVTADEIVLHRSGVSDLPSRSSHVIGRSSGTYLQTLEDPRIGLFILTHGTCQAAPFSGLPAPKF